MNKEQYGEYLIHHCSNGGKLIKRTQGVLVQWFLDVPQSIYVDVWPEKLPDNFIEENFNRSGLGTRGREYYSLKTR